MEQQILDEQQQSVRFYYTNVKTLYVISLLTIGISMLCFLFRIFCVYKFKTGYYDYTTGTGSSTDLMWYAHMVDNLAVAALVIMVLSWIPFFMWVYRMYYNLDSAKLKGLNVEPGWAVGWCFIPFANLYYTPVVFNDLLKGSKHLATGASPGQSIEYTPQFPWGGVWLVVRVLGGVLSYMGIYRIKDGDLSVFDSACNFEMISGLLTVISGVIIMYIIIKVTKDQNTVISNGIA